MKRAHLIVAGIGLCACAGLGKLAMSKAGASGMEVVDPLQSPAVTANGTLVAASAATPSLQLVYRVDFESKLSSEQAAGYSVVGSLTWTLSPRAGAGGTSRFWCQATGVSVVIDGDDTEQATKLAALLTSELGQSFALELDESGRVVRLGLEKTARPSLGLGVQKSLSAALQFVRSGEGAERWSTRERDHLGDYDASYRALGGGGFEKLKRYSKLALPQTVDATQGETQVTSALRLVLGFPATRLPSRVELDEQVRHAGFRSSTKATLELDAARTRPGDSRSELGELNWLGLQENVTLAIDPAIELEQKRALVKGATLRDLLGELEKLPPSGDTLQQRQRSLARLRALLDIDPRAVSDVVHALKHSETRGQAPALLGALSDSISPEARDALADLGKDPTLPSDLRGDAITNLALQPKPSAQTFEDLQQLSASEDVAVRDSAVLGLGATARQAADADETKALAEQAAQRLGQRAQDATDPEAKRLYLEGVGNAGGQNALEAAGKALTDANPELRAAGVASLRFAPAPHADTLIAKAWLEDASPLVREQAAFAAAFRLGSTILGQAAIQVLRTDSDGGVRQGAVKVMSEQFAEQPAAAEAIKSALAAAAKGDADEGVQVAAARALGAIDGDAPIAGGGEH